MFLRFEQTVANSESMSNLIENRFTMKTRPVLLSILAATALVFVGQDTQSAQPHMTPEMEVRALKKKVSELEAKLARLEARMNQMQGQPKITFAPGASPMFVPQLNVPRVVPRQPVPAPHQSQRQVNGQAFYVVPLSE